METGGWNLPHLLTPGLPFGVSIEGVLTGPFHLTFHWPHLCFLLCGSIPLISSLTADTLSGILWLWSDDMDMHGNEDLLGTFDYFGFTALNGGSTQPFSHWNWGARNRAYLSSVSCRCLWRPTGNWPRAWKSQGRAWNLITSMRTLHIVIKRNWKEHIKVTFSREGRGPCRARQCSHMQFGLKDEVEVKAAALCSTLRKPMDCSLPGSSVHGIL